MNTMTANGLEFGYLAEGPSDGPLALCLHGFPDSARTWRHLLPVLADAGFRAVAPFMRGYAPTSVPGDGAYQTGALAADANALHEALGGGPDAVLIGHDWGAAAAYGAAAMEPGRWRRVVTMALPPLDSMLTSFFDYEQLRRSFYIFLFQTPLAEMSLNRSFVEGLWRDWSPGYDATEDVAHAMECLSSPEHVAAAIGYYRAMLDPSRHVEAYAAQQQAASRIGERPVLYLHGADDGCLGADLIKDAERHLPPGSRTALVPAAGHFLQLERPDAVNARVLGWLTG
ncbi:alpha/beta fold hydrolase [Actinomadura sp. HBU206391]|uniref:alpha/beta fold hydrolase n=1 Tax=Actinomadura sp. HBU206391 TaxID=2731692 RepID=UPI0016506E78|nr:alpha/beta hydrolase [Actinomadura sp. HBU206391]MBC6461700.1 alpha/beta hydrolase [Actinomadura sp. HBU206391]